MSNSVMYFILGQTDSVGLLTLAKSVAYPMISAGVTFFLTKYVKNKQFKLAYQPNNVKSGTKKNTVLMAGIGRVGKSQLVSTMSEQHPSSKRTITQKFRVITGEFTYDNIKHYYHISDYRGQNFAQLISSFVEEQLYPNTDYRYGDVNTLLLVVDLFPEESNQSDRSKVYFNFDRERVEHNIKSWNMLALDALFGLLTKEGLQLVCLYINKLDKLAYNQDSERRKEILEAYQELINTLEERATNSEAAFEVILGSAENGMNLIGQGGLINLLTQHSVPKLNRYD